MRARSILAGLVALVALAPTTAPAVSPNTSTWLHTALVEGCVASFKPGTGPEDMMKAGFAPGGEVDERIRKRLSRGLGGVTWFSLVVSQGTVHVGRSAVRPVCFVVQTQGSSEAGVTVARERLIAAKATRISSTPGKTLTRDLFSIAAGTHTMWISLAHTNDYEPGDQGASAVIVVELKKR